MCVFVGSAIATKKAVCPLRVDERQESFAFVWRRCLLLLSSPMLHLRFPLIHSIRHMNTRGAVVLFCGLLVREISLAFSVLI